MYIKTYKKKIYKYIQLPLASYEGGGDMIEN